MCSKELSEGTTGTTSVIAPSVPVVSIDGEADLDPELDPELAATEASDDKSPL